jgi:hypothetical protein
MTAVLEGSSNSGEIDHAFLPSNNSMEPINLIIMEVGTKLTALVRNI